MCPAERGGERRTKTTLLVRGKRGSWRGVRSLASKMRRDRMSDPSHSELLPKSRSRVIEILDLVYEVGSRQGMIVEAAWGTPAEQLVPSQRVRSAASRPPSDRDPRDQRALGSQSGICLDVPGGLNSSSASRCVLRRYAPTTAAEFAALPAENQACPRARRDQHHASDNRSTTHRGLLHAGARPMK